MELSLIIPTYNEVKNIPHLFAELHTVLEGVDVEYIVIDDNSPDGTADIAESLKAMYPIQVVRRPGKAGLGSAVRAGMSVAKGRILGYIAAGAGEIRGFTV
jgi:dolichol-phosphate mannosyltransferase